MVVAAAALESGIIDPEKKIYCEGFLNLGRNRMHCWKRSGHGYLNVVEAIENSCNVFFYKVAMELGIDKIKEYALKFGLGKLSGIDLPSELSGVVPDREWKLKRFKTEWMKGETPNVAIGQGYLTVTPIQLINYINVIANGGYLIRPRIVKQYMNNSKQDPQADGEPVQELIESNIVKQTTGLKPETIEILRAGMKANVQGQNGTGKQARSGFVSIAGKTGTTQVVSLKTREKLKREKGNIDEKYFDHAWFVAFAPAENPVITATVMIEHGMAGRNSAALAREIIEYYFTKHSSILIPQFIEDSSEYDPFSSDI
jgi:penicillin-binding protein 2